MMHISYSFPPCHATLSIKKVLHLKNLLSLDEEPPVFWSAHYVIFKAPGRLLIAGAARACSFDGSPGTLLSTTIKNCGK